MTPTTEQLKDLLAKVTPGEWRVEDGTTLVWGDCKSEDRSTRGMGYPIAAARVNPSGNWSSGPYADEGQANSTLIALAPTLAAEVVRLREAMELVQTVYQVTHCHAVARQALDATSAV